MSEKQADLRIVQLLRDSGPFTGAELLEATGQEALALWRSCLNHPQIATKVVGRRYLRLDRNVQGYARLSPSIRREFLTYTLLDCNTKQDRLEKRAEELEEDIANISSEKRSLARRTVATLMEELPGGKDMARRICFIIAGDIVYNMAHRVPRPERSTGRLVRGSDLDLIVVVDDSLPADQREALDSAIFQKKYRLLISPGYREELDYLVKDLSTIRRQLAFDTFEHMVACKILAEGEFLYGSAQLFTAVKELLAQSQAPAKIEALMEQAAAERAAAEEILRRQPNGRQKDMYMNLFYTTDENDEIY